MKTTISKILIVLLVLFSALSIASSASKKLITTPFNGSELSVGLSNPGTVKVVGGMTITRGLVVNAIDTMSDPRVSGDVTTVVNSVYKGDGFTGTGPLWGTIQISNSGGGWNLKFTGKQSAGCQTVVRAWGWGEGSYQGMTGVWDYLSNTCMLTSEVSGHIVEPR